MSSAEFKQLITDREEWFRVTQRNGFDFTPILSGMYSDSSHFIYEILQNAEDAKAQSITFSIFPDRLEITHDGKSFTFKDVESITSIGKSTKADDITAIGKFGVGFKSVYAITQSPTIRSGIFDFTIKNFVVPIINDDRQSQSNTRIILPFNHQSRNPAEIHALVKNRLENLDLLTLLFLKSITKVVWEESENTGQYERFVQSKYKGLDHVRRVRLASSTSPEDYIVFERPVTISQKELRVEIAYKVSLSGENKEKIVESTTSRLFVFLPTNEETYIKFLMQGPFRTTPARDNIPFEDTNNKFLIQEIATLVADSLPIVRELGLLDVGFLNVLPLKDLSMSKKDIYNTVFNEVVKAFTSTEPLIPSHWIPHCRANQALLPGSKELIQLLDSSDIAELFEKTEWVHSDITEHTAEIKEFFINKVAVSEIDFETFVRAVTINFLKRKDVTWFKDLYRMLKDKKSLWRAGAGRQLAGIIRSKPIIRLENGDQIVPFDSEGNPQVYLPTTSNRKTQFKIVHKEIAADEEALSFLRELGLREPDLYTEISEYLIPKYGNNQVTPASNEYYEDFLNIIIGYQEIQSDRKRKFIESLKNLPFVLCTRSNSSEILLASPSVAYFRTPELQEYFSGFDEALFVAEELFDKFEKVELKQFLKELGVSELPRRIESDDTLSWLDKSKLHDGIGHTRDIYDHDYVLHGLDTFFLNGSKHRSIVLWNLLIRHIQESGFGWRAEEFFKGNYKWFFRTEHTASYEATFTRKLRQNSWLFDNSGTSRNSVTISLSSLSSEYECKTPASQILIRQLQFKSDIQQELLQLLPENKRKNFEVLLGLSPEELEEMASQLKKNKTPEPTNGSVKNGDTDDWTYDVTPDEADISKVQFIPLVHGGLILDNPYEVETEDPDAEEKTNGKPKPEVKIPSKRMGWWGEKHVFKALLQDFESKGTAVMSDSGAKIITDKQTIEIIWLNIKKDRGRGCDFIIKENGINSAYIEVKSTSDSDRQLFQITGTQWELARRLYNIGLGEQYWIYRVIKAGKKDPQIETIQNPIKMWRDGRLYAHPINIEL